MDKKQTTKPFTLYAEPEELSPLELLVNDVKSIPAEELQNKTPDGKLGTIISRFVEISFDSPDIDNNYIQTDRKTRATFRQMIPGALDTINKEFQDDPEFKDEIVGGLTRNVGRLGIEAHTIAELAQYLPKKPEKQAAPKEQKELIPKVAEADKQFLENLVANVAETGKWSTQTTRDAAAGFLDIYYPAETKINKNASSHQEILDAIASCGTYSHAIAAALSKLSPLEQTSRISDTKDEILKQMMLRADKAKLSRLTIKDDFELMNEPELLEFNGAIKGARYEVLAYETIAEFKDMLKFDSVEYSSLEDDISHGFDLVITINGKEYYIDIKAQRSFDRSVKKYPKHTVVSDRSDEGYVVRQTNHKDTAGQPTRIIVIDAETTGAIGYSRNRLGLGDPKRYLQTILKGIAAVDNTDK